MDIPSWSELLRVAPTAAIVMTVAWGSVWLYRSFHNEDRNRERNDGETRRKD